MREAIGVRSFCKQIVARFEDEGVDRDGVFLRTLRACRCCVSGFGARRGSSWRQALGASCVELGITGGKITPTCGPVVQRWVAHAQRLRRGSDHRHLLAAGNTSAGWSSDAFVPELRRFRPRSNERRNELIAHGRRGREDKLQRTLRHLARHHLCRPISTQRVTLSRGIQKEVAAGAGLRPSE
jgi:hypothetical protein